MSNQFDITEYNFKTPLLSGLSKGSGLFLTGACPCKHQKTALGDLRTLKTLGVEYIFSLISNSDLRQLGINNPFSDFINYGFAVTHFPIDDRSVPNLESHLTLRSMILKMETYLESNKVFYIHCQAGLGRTGLVTALLFRRLGMSPKNAISIVRLHRPGSVETKEQEDFVHNFDV